MLAETKNIEITNSMALYNHYEKEAQKWYKIAEERKQEKNEMANMIIESRENHSKCEKRLQDTMQQIKQLEFLSKQKQEQIDSLNKRITIIENGH